MSIRDRLPFLSAAENRESFFNRIAFWFPRTDRRYIQIERAYDVAKDVFREIYRENGDRYFEHVRAVVLIYLHYFGMTNYQDIMELLLHDVSEDDLAWPIKRIQREFGQRVAKGVDYLTNPSEKEFPSKKDREEIRNTRMINAPKSFFKKKFCDRLHNTIDLGGCTKEKRQRKIRETREHYLPYAKMYGILYEELLEALAEAEAIDAKK